MEQYLQRSARARACFPTSIEHRPAESSPRTRLLRAERGHGSSTLRYRSDGTWCSWSGWVGARVRGAENSFIEVSDYRRRAAATGCGRRRVKFIGLLASPNWKRSFLLLRIQDDHECEDATAPPGCPDDWVRSSACTPAGREWRTRSVHKLFTLVFGHQSAGDFGSMTSKLWSWFAFHFSWEVLLPFWEAAPNMITPILRYYAISCRVK